MAVRVLGLERSKLIPQEIHTALATFRRELVAPLVEDFRRTEPAGNTWPKGRRKTIQAQTGGVVKGDTVVIGTFHSRFARSLDQGDTVQPRKKQVIRFRNQAGDFVFTRKPITHAPRPFFARVLTQVPAIVAGVYERVMGEIGRG